MALVPCRDCGNDISDSSIKCIHCGALMKTGHKVVSGVGEIVGNSIQFFFMILIFVGIPVSLISSCLES